MSEMEVKYQNKFRTAVKGRTIFLKRSIKLHKIKAQFKWEGVLKKKAFAFLSKL